MDALLGEASQPFSFLPPSSVRSNFKENNLLLNRGEFFSERLAHILEVSSLTEAKMISRKLFLFVYIYMKKNGDVHII